MKSYRYDDDGRVELVSEDDIKPVSHRSGTGRRRATYVRQPFGSWLVDVRWSFAMWFGLGGVIALVVWCAAGRVV
jgi:hypothetical protein